MEVQKRYAHAVTRLAQVHTDGAFPQHLIALSASYAEAVRTLDS